MAKTYSIQKKTFIKAPIEQVWEFFSSPQNLEKITPKDMRFEILTELNGDPVFEGQIIEYYVRPMMNQKMHWVTEITGVKQNEYFTDRQLKGPYKLWDHKHTFVEKDGGVEMTDVVKYQLPLGFLGQIAHALFVRKRVEEIFEYREQVIKDLF